MYKIFGVTYDILCGINATIWGGVEQAQKVGQIVKTGLSGADVLIGANHAIEDVLCNDPICATLDVVGSISSAVGLVIGNIPSTKHLTTITGSITVGCRSVRFYCRKYGTVWGCTIAAGQGLKAGLQFTLKNKDLIPTPKP